MKRFAICCILLVLVGCSKSSPSSTFRDWVKESERIRVLSTTAMIDDIVARIGGERIVHLTLIQGEIDPHSYELVKGDGEKLSLARLIFYNGLGLEHGASLRYQLENTPSAVAVGNSILERYPDRVLYEGNEVDPHLWMDIALWSEIIEPIQRALVQADPQGEAYYVLRAEELKQEMLQAHAQVMQKLHAIDPLKRYLVTSHDAFNYFTRAYLATEEEVLSDSWRVRFQAPEGLAPDGQLSVSDIRKVVDHLISYQIHTVFPEANVSRDSLKKIAHVCGKQGFPVTVSAVALYGDTLDSSYLHMIEHNAAVLAKAWEESP